MGTCGASCGITKTREREREQATKVALRAFADGKRETPRWWPSASVFDAGSAERLAEAVRGALPCRALVLPPADELAATWIYIVATMADTSWVELRAGRHGLAPEAIEERGLRVGLSPLYRTATVQEFVVSATVEGGSVWIEEARVAGVSDRRLQLFVKASQGLLQSLKIPTLDAAFLEGVAVEGGDPLWSLLFDDAPMVSRAGEWLKLPLAALRLGGLSCAPDRLYEAQRDVDYAARALVPSAASTIEETAERSAVRPAPLFRS